MSNPFHRINTQRLPASSYASDDSTALTISNRKFESLRSILTSLLLTTPPELTPNQLSPDLLMRQRMLGVVTPHAYDSSETFSSSSALISDAERNASQRAFTSSISRPPIELTISSTDIGLTAHNLFQRRIKAHAIAKEGEEDPIELFDYDTFCCDAWHTQRRLLVRFPQVEEFEEVKLYMMLVGDDEGVLRLDNLFSLRQAEMEQVEGGLHRWPERCTARAGRQRQEVQSEEERQREEQGGAEYINDADDFWAGFSDDGESGDGKRVVQADDGVATRGAEAQARDKTEQEKAIKDIIRGAFTLHRSIRESGQDAVDEFMQLVRSAITNQ